MAIIIFSVKFDRMWEEVDGYLQLAELSTGQDRAVMCKKALATIYSMIEKFNEWLEKPDDSMLHDMMKVASHIEEFLQIYKENSSVSI